MANGAGFIFPEKPAEPPDPIASDNNIRIYETIDIVLTGDMSTHNDKGIRAEAADELTHSFYFPHIGKNGADPNHVIVVLLNLGEETLLGRKIQQGAGGVDIGLDHHQPKGAMKHPERKSTLHPCHLIMIELHGIDGPASVFIIAAIGPEDI